MTSPAQIVRSVADQGPIYAETVLGRFPVEPLNTLSNLVFLLVAAYWTRRTRLDFRRHPVTVAALPILLVGFLGGTTYHATRAHDIWRLLDVYPIVVLALLASVYMWNVIFGNSLKALLAIAIPSVAYRILAEIFPESHLTMIGLGYGFLAFIICSPAVIESWRNRWRGLRDISLAGTFFAVALVMRQSDEFAGRMILPSGTHFLWHILGGVSAFFAFSFIFAIEERAAPAEGSGQK